jgi:hypothetical protein
MRVLFYSGGVTGSGHIVLGLCVAAALKRSGMPYEVAILSVETPFAQLARRSGVSIMTLPAEEADALGPERYRESALFRAIDSYRPDFLIVDLFWFNLDAFLRELPCKKILLIRQVDPAIFHFRVPGRELTFPARQIEPLVLRDRDEIMDRAAARADLGFGDKEETCLFAFNGKQGEGASAWKSYSYLREEGWKVYRSDNRQGGLFPAVDWFNAFDMLVCGAGYSAFWEARAFGKEAFFLPFPRRFEDQARRAALNADYRPRANGADELVALLRD